jgi:hypothetical protein
MNVRIAVLVVLGIAILVNICLIPPSAWQTFSGWEIPKITLFMLAAAATYLLAHWIYSEFELNQKEIVAVLGKTNIVKDTAEKKKPKTDRQG